MLPEEWQYRIWLISSGEAREQSVLVLCVRFKTVLTCKLDSTSHYQMTIIFWVSVPAWSCGKVGSHGRRRRCFNGWENGHQQTRITIRQKNKLKIFQSGWIYIVIMSAINSASTSLELVDIYNQRRLCFALSNMFWRTKLWHLTPVDRERLYLLNYTSRGQNL